MRGRSAALKETKSCGTQGTFFRSFVRSSVPLGLSGLKFSPPGLKSALSGLTDLRPERADFRPQKVDYRPGRADFSPEGAWGNGQTDGQNDN